MSEAQASEASESAPAEAVSEAVEDSRLSPVEPDLGDEDISEESEETSEDTSEETAEPEKEKPVFTPEQQEVFNREIGKKVASQREAERQLQESREMLAEMAAKLAPDNSRPQIPDVPDPLDNDFEQKIKERDDAIRNAVEWDTKQYANEQQLFQQEEAARKTQMETLNKAVETYKDRADKLNITGDELKEAGQVVQNYGLPNPLVAHILDEKLGPQITMYLSKNPMEAEALAQMPFNRAFVAISTEIAQKAQGMIKKVSPSAEPTETLRGAGGKVERGPKGATFE